MTKSRIDKAIAVIMVASYFIETMFDGLNTQSLEWQEMKDSFGSDMESPALLFVSLILIAVFSLLIGAVGRFAEWRGSNTALTICVIAVALSYPAYSVYVSSSVSALSGFIWAVAIGWLIARPVDSLSESTKSNTD